MFFINILVSYFDTTTADFYNEVSKSKIKGHVMLALQIDNKEIESAFVTKFNADKDKLISFIEKSLKQSKNTENEFDFDHLDPLKHCHSLEVETNAENEDNLTNPFENVEDVSSFSKKLRTSSYR